MGELSRELTAFFAGAGVVGLLVLYALFMPNRAKIVAGWLAGLVGTCVRCVDRIAVTCKVEGAINSMRDEMQRNAPNLLEKSLRVKWANVDEAEAQLRDGEVLVVMRRSRNRDENVAHAVMAYLPKALLTHARQYIDKERMRAADLVIAKSLFYNREEHVGALKAFYERHLDPARDESTVLRQKIAELDGLDLEGWLTRILLSEYQTVGEDLYPGEPSDECIEDSEHFAHWLHGLSARNPGDDAATLTYSGQFFSAAIIFVARPELLERRGLAPYRRRAKRYLYMSKFDVVYLIGRDQTIAPIEDLAADLESDARVSEVSRYTYKLRHDFRIRKRLNRQRAIVICLRRRQGPEVATTSLVDQPLRLVAEGAR